MAEALINTDTLSASPFVPSTPDIVATGFVNVNGNKVVVNGDSVVSHTNFSPDPDVVHSGAAMISSQSYVRINGKSVVRRGDSASCSHSNSISSQSFFRIN